MPRIVTVLAAAALGLAAPAPASADGDRADPYSGWQKKFQRDMKRAEDLAKEQIEELRRALEETLRKMPRYGLPEVTPEGDIIIRKYPRPEAPEDPDVDEISA